MLAFEIGREFFEIFRLNVYVHLIVFVENRVDNVVYFPVLYELFLVFVCIGLLEFG